LFNAGDAADPDDGLAEILLSASGTAPGAGVIVEAGARLEASGVITDATTADFIIDSAFRVPTTGTQTRVLNTGALLRVANGVERFTRAAPVGGTISGSITVAGGTLSGTSLLAAIGGGANRLAIAPQAVITAQNRAAS
jgi:hypothetical protein